MAVALGSKRHVEQFCAAREENLGGNHRGGGHRGSRLVCASQRSELSTSAAHFSQAAL